MDIFLLQLLKSLLTVEALLMAEQFRSGKVFLKNSYHDNALFHVMASELISLRQVRLGSIIIEFKEDNWLSHI